jgi:hypothetical protein
LSTIINKVGIRSLQFNQVATIIDHHEAGPFPDRQATLDVDLSPSFRWQLVISAYQHQGSTRQPSVYSVGLVGRGCTR